MVDGRRLACRDGLRYTSLTPIEDPGLVVGWVSA
jgi:hypothetical protein